MPSVKCQADAAAPKGQSNTIAPLISNSSCASATGDFAAKSGPASPSGCYLHRKFRGFETESRGISFRNAQPSAAEYIGLAAPPFSSMPLMIASPCLVF